MSKWISYKTAAALMECSVDHISALARAAECRGQPLDEIPVSVRGYLNSGFPRPIRFGKRLKRIDVLELQQWIKGR